MEVYVDDMLVKIRDKVDHLDDLKENFDTLYKYKMKLNPTKCVFVVSSGKFMGFMVSQWGIEVNPDKLKVIMEIKSLRTMKEV